jgi:hypothetical protein
MEFITLGIGTPSSIGGFLLVGLFDADAVVVPDPSFIRFADEAYAAPSATAQSYDGDSQDE